MISEFQERALRKAQLDFIGYTHGDLMWVYGLEYAAQIHGLIPFSQANVMLHGSVLSKCDISALKHPPVNKVYTEPADGDALYLSLITLINMHTVNINQLINDEIGYPGGMQLGMNPIIYTVDNVDKDFFKISIKGCLLNEDDALIANDGFKNLNKELAKYALPMRTWICSVFGGCVLSTSDSTCDIKVYYKIGDKDGKVEIVISARVNPIVNAL